VFVICALFIVLCVFVSEFCPRSLIGHLAVEPGDYKKRTKLKWNALSFSIVSAVAVLGDF